MNPTEPRRHHSPRSAGWVSIRARGSPVGGGVLLMENSDEKEYIQVMPPVYHFKRVVIFKAAAKAFESIGMYYEARKCEIEGIYELALGFEALVYESLPKAKLIGITDNGEQFIP